MELDSQPRVSGDCVDFVHVVSSSFRSHDAGDSRAENNCVMLPTTTPATAAGSERVTHEYPNSIYEESTSEKALFLFCAALAMNCSTISVPIYFPILSALADFFNTTIERINLTATVYSIFQGASPIFWAAMSDAWGRRPVYFACVTTYVAANIGLALAPNYAALLCLRCLQAFGAASTVSLCGGVAGDITSRRTRGALVGISLGFGQIGSCFGPLIGAAIMQTFNSWRAIYWFLSIFGAVALILLAIFLPETNRHIVGNGSRMPTSPYLLSCLPYIWIRSKRCGVPYTPGSPEFERAWRLPPTKVRWMRWSSLFFQPDVLLVLIPTSLHYTAWFMSLTAQSTVFSRDYKFSTLKIGYTYLASGVGMLGGSLLSGKILQWSYKRRVTKASEKNVNIYAARLELCFFWSLMQIVALLIFGWTLHFFLSYYVSTIMTFVISVSATQFLNSTATLLVDLFPDDSAASQSCNNLSRCFMCAAGLAAVDRMMRVMTIGGTFTFMAGICAVSLICIAAELKFGARIAMRPE